MSDDTDNTDSLITIIDNDKTESLVTILDDNKSESCDSDDTSETEYESPIISCLRKCCTNDVYKYSDKKCFLIFSASVIITYITLHVKYSEYINDYLDILFILFCMIFVCTYCVFFVC